MKKAEAIIFDLGGVILNIDYNLTKKAFENSGIKNFDDMYSQANANDLFSKLETGKIDEEDFYKEINLRTGLGLQHPEIREAWNAMLLTFREKSLEFLDKLKSKYKLFLLSNTNHIHLQEFNKIYLDNKREKPFKDYFESAYYSCEIGLRKPEVEIFNWVLEQNNLKADTTIFIDDSVQNIEGAKLAGMQTILLKSGMYIQDLDL